jgi:pSer/pThr/pTyr-binding forkhead associated (FHA) protein
MSSIPSAPPALSAELRCQLRPDALPEVFRLRGDEVVIGRGAGVKVRLSIPTVSSRHARIRVREGAYWIENLSPAGTFVNAHRDRDGRIAGLVARPRRLRHLDVITLGKNVDLLFLLYDAGQQAAQRKGIVRAALVPEETDAVPFPLELGETSIGRHAHNNLVIPNGAVSGTHARIERGVRQLVLRDLDSRNGTTVNGARVSTAQLNDGDLLCFGDVVRFRVAIESGMVESGAFEAGAAVTEELQRPRSQLWRTRIEWNSSEIREIAQLNALLKAREEQAAGALGAQGRVAKGKTDPPRDRTVLPGGVKPPPRPAPAPPAAAPPAPGPPAAARAASPPATLPPAATPAPPPAKVSPASAPILEVRLVVRGLPGGDQVLQMSEPGTYDVGRSSSSRLRIQHPTVSRRHAVLTLTGDRSAAIVEDAGSANPTRLNGAPVQKPCALSHGDTLDVGMCRLEVSLRRDERNVRERS